MSTLVIEGGRRIEGRVDVEGNKNAALPLIAACLLTAEWCTLHNMPRIADVEVMARLLLDLGADVEGIGSTTLRIRCANITKDEPDSALVGRLRGSVLLMGPLLARRGRAIVAPPGGDFPARRTIKTHLEAVTAMGAVQLPGSGHRLELRQGLKPASIYLDEASVTGTETALLTAAAAAGTSEIRHAACEPHVVELCEFLRAMGVGITGEGSHTIRVEGLAKPRGAEKTLYGDYIEAGSWAVVGAITGGHIEVGGTRPVDMEVVASVLTKMGVKCVQDNDVFRVEVTKLVGAGRITTGLWPGFPSDLVSLVTVLATQADGATLVHDWMYELRLFALEQMSGMGADLFLCDPHRIIVTGPHRLRGKSLDSRDIRSGMALIAAALIADGQSRVEPLETVERGYSRVVERLQQLGGSVSKI
jgi:UDP-N-acetylglucosamine 1-carboxyvinyltransferase